MTLRKTTAAITLSLPGGISAIVNRKGTVSWEPVRSQHP